MSTVSSLLIERFRRLPRRSGEVWQVAMLRLPTWIEDPGRGRHRPQAGICVSLRSGRVHVKPESTAPSAADLVVETLLEFGTKSSLAGCRPSRIEVATPTLGERLMAAIGDPDLQILVRDRLPELALVIEDLARATAAESPIPDALSAQGVTAEKMRRFAEAANAFYEAAPWRHLTNDDLIRVESPHVEEELSHVSVMGGGGREFGLAFLESADDFEDLVGGLEPAEFFRDRPHWSVSFGPMWDLPFGDVDLWEDARLPVASPEAYPIAFQASLDEPPLRPDAPTLAYFEGLLRAFAETTEADLDKGRWTRSVTTADGAVTFKLALCDLVDKPKRSRRVPDRRIMEGLLAGMERTLASGAFETVEQANEALQSKVSGRSLDEMPAGVTALEKAQDLIFQAFEARGRRQLQLARQALALSPDCADAYVLLAERTPDAEAALDLYLQGVAAGERALGQRMFEEETGHFWGMVQTRPYMRARFGLAQTFHALDRIDEAIGHYRELLRLNPNDNQGVRIVLLPLLLELGRDEEAGRLLAEYADDGTAMWTYGYALWTFRKEGHSPAARERLRVATRSNRHGVRFLIADPSTYDVDVDMYALGSEGEAIACARELADAWRRTPGAIAWLRAAGGGHGKTGKKRRR
jgi:tetratricopeptide (TPR) repeat protein